MSNEFEENLSAQQRRENDARQSAIDTISDLYPPDSEYTDTAKQGQADMLDAMAQEWRSLPVTVLEYMAKTQTWRDNHP